MSVMDSENTQVPRTPLSEMSTGDLSQYLHHEHGFAIGRAFEEAVRNNTLNDEIITGITTALIARGDELGLYLVYKVQEVLSVHPELHEQLLGIIELFSHTEMRVVEKKYVELCQYSDLARSLDALSLFIQKERSYNFFADFSDILLLLESQTIQVFEHEETLPATLVIAWEHFFLSVKNNLLPIVEEDQKQQYIELLEIFCKKNSYLDELLPVEIKKQKPGLLKRLSKSLAGKKQVAMELEISQEIIRRSDFLPSLYNLPTDVQDRLKALVRQVYLHEKDGWKKIKLIETLFKKNSQQIEPSLAQHGIQIHEITQIIDAQLATMLLSTFIPLLPESSNLISYLIITFNIRTLPQEIATSLGLHLAESEINLKPAHNNLMLCPNSEQYLESAIEAENAVLVNGFLLVKSKQNGLRTGLCIRTTSVGNAAFLAGCWYSPTSQETKLAIDTAVQEKKRSISLQQGEWAYMRPLARNYKTGESPESILAFAKRTAAAILTQY